MSLKIMISNEKNIETRARKLVKKIVENTYLDDWPKTDLAHFCGICYSCRKVYWSVKENDGECDDCFEDRREREMREDAR